MYVIYGMAALVVCCMIQFGITLIIELSVLDLAFLLFFGAFFAAMFVSHKIIKGLIKGNKRESGWWRLICVLSGLVTFIALYYAEYKALSVRGNLNATMSTDLFDYIGFKLKYVDQLFLRKHARPLELRTAGIPNYIIFVLQIACSLFGAYVGSCREHKYYCRDCHKFYLTKKLFTAERDELKPLIKKDQICITDINVLMEFMDKHKAGRKNKGNYDGLLMYCSDCGKAQIVIKNKNYDKKEKKVFMEKSVDVDKHWVDELIKKGV